MCSWRTWQHVVSTRKIWLASDLHRIYIFEFPDETEHRHCLRNMQRYSCVYVMTRCNWHAVDTSS